MSHHIVIADPLGSEGLDILRREPSVAIEELPVGLARPELLLRVRDAAGLIVRSATQVTAELLAAAPKLVVVVRAGAGVDNIDVPAATAHGVLVMNTPGANTVAAAEHTMGLLLSLARRIPAANRSLLEGRWERSKFVGWELRDKTLGLLGVGRIGMEVAARALAFKMRILGYDPYISRDAAAAHGIQLTALEAVLETADVISLHLPLVDETRHILDATRLARMKRGAYLINCARGGLVDEPALLAALASGQLGGAALDVFEEEPKPAAALVADPRIVATPHLGASTLEAQSSVGILAARQILGVLRGESFENAVNLPAHDSAGPPFRFRRH